MIYGVSGVLVAVLVIDSVFCALKEIYGKDNAAFEAIFL